MDQTLTRLTREGKHPAAKAIRALRLLGPEQAETLLEILQAKLSSTWFTKNKKIKQSG